MLAGGTSGIGESTCREFVRNTVRPTVYIVGRNKVEASRIIRELEKINPEAKINFLEKDLTLLRNVDSVCNDIKKEKVVNLLFLSAGFLSMKGRDGTLDSQAHFFKKNSYNCSSNSC